MTLVSPQILTQAWSRHKDPQKPHRAKPAVLIETDTGPLLTPCLVGAVEQGENIPFLHGDLSRALLLIVVESQDQLLPSLVIHGGHLLLKIPRKGKPD